MTKPHQVTETELGKRKRQYELEILRLLRKNSRSKNAHMAKTLNMPAATFANVLKETAGKYVMKYSSIIDFEKLGYFVGSIFVISLPKMQGEKAALLEFLTESRNTNTISRTTDDELVVETYFKDMAEFVDFRHFVDELAEYSEEHEIISSVEKEIFLA